MKKIVFKIFYLCLFLIQPDCFPAAQESANEKVASEVSNDQAKKIFESVLQDCKSTPLAKRIAKVGLFTIFATKKWTAEDLRDAAKPEFRDCIIEAINQTTNSTLHPEAHFCWGNIKHYGDNPSFSQAIKYYSLAIQQNSSPRAKFLACFGILKIADESQKKPVGKIDKKFCIDREDIQECCVEILFLSKEKQICNTVDQKLIDDAVELALIGIKP